MQVNHASTLCVAFSRLHYCNLNLRAVCPILPGIELFFAHINLLQLLQLEIVWIRKHLIRHLSVFIDRLFVEDRHLFEVSLCLLLELELLFVPFALKLAIHRKALVCVLG
jgi:hypothetical protein